MDDAFNGRRKTDLYVAYKSAFAAWASEVRSLQADLGDCVTTADGQERVRRRTKQTEHLYREKRNQLWESLAG